MNAHRDCHSVEQELCSDCEQPSNGRLTRDPDFPVEAAQLMASFNLMSGGYETLHVVEAAANFFICALHTHVRAQGGDKADALILASQFGKDLGARVAEQWDRKPQPTDVEVRHG